MLGSPTIVEGLSLSYYSVKLLFDCLNVCATFNVTERQANDIHSNVLRAVKWTLTVTGRRINLLPVYWQ